MYKDSILNNVLNIIFQNLITVIIYTSTNYTGYEYNVMYINKD